MTYYSCSIPYYYNQAGDFNNFHTFSKGNTFLGYRICSLDSGSANNYSMPTEDNRDTTKTTNNDDHGTACLIKDKKRASFSTWII